MSIFSETVRDAFAAQQAIAGEWVTYVCAHGELPLLAVPGTSLMDQVAEQGLVRHESHDYLILATDLAFGGVRYEPQRGDRIVHGPKTYEVNAPDDATPCFRYRGTTNDLMRIHTAHVDGEACA